MHRDLRPDGRAEIDMQTYWRACRKCLSAIAAKSRKDLKQVVALSIASQGVTFVPVDRQGRQLRKAIVLYDGRACREAEDLIHHLRAGRALSNHGAARHFPDLRGHQAIVAGRHEPSCFRNIHKVLLVHDFLVYRLTGTFAAVPSLLSSSLLLDVKAGKWWGPMLDYLGLSPEQLPDIYDHGQPVATVGREAARQTGLSTKTLVVNGALDQICGMTGVGNIAPGVLSESTGTVLAVHTLADGLFPQSAHGIHNFRHLRDGRYALIGVCPTACSALDWLLANFTGEDHTAATGARPDAYTRFFRQAARVPRGSDGVMMLPHLAGGGSPRPNPRAAGVFCGLKLHHSQGYFVRALLEAIAFALLSNIEVFQRSGIEIRELRSFGGGSRNRFWNQIKADVSGLPVATSQCPEPGCMGAAILAGVGGGVFRNVAWAAGGWWPSIGRSIRSRRRPRNMKRSIKTTNNLSNT